MAIALRKKDEINKLRRAGAIVGQTLEFLKDQVKPGMSLKEVDSLGEEFLRKLGAEPSFKGLYGFPSAVCTSVNEVIIHGIPTDYKLKDGDILGIDIGSKIDGYFGDAAITIPVGEISLNDQKLIECAKDSLFYAIEAIKAGMRFKELSKIIEEKIKSYGFVPLRDYCGHGIGKKPHEEPNVLNYVEGKVNQGPKIKNGMVFCIEPMVAQKDPHPVVLNDNWSVVSQDGLNGSHYEHQVAIVDGKAQILTLP
jgi:methionyl aminopeptidase